MASLTPNISTDVTARLQYVISQPNTSWGAKRIRFLDGTSQSYLEVDKKLRSWQLLFEARDQTEMDSIMNFLDARRGSFEKFYFDHPHDDVDVPVYLDDQSDPDIRWENPAKRVVSILVHETT